MKTLKTIAMLSLLFLLASCGGGGSNGSGGTTPSAAPVTGDVDTTAPTVVSKTPVSGSSGGTVYAAISATFSEAIDKTTINETTFTVSSGGSNVSGSIAFDASGTTATFTPALPLASGKVYSVTLKGSIKDKVGNPMSYDVAWNFSTAAIGVPFVTKTFPDNNASGVCLDLEPFAWFNKNLALATVNPSTFQLNNGTGNISGTVSAYNSSSDPFSSAWFFPSSRLKRFTSYTGRITTGVTDLGGTPMATDYTWSFKTSWAVEMGSDREDESHAIATDSVGNVYMAGFSKGDFDGNTNTSMYWADLAVVKFNSLGVKQWSRQFGSTYDDVANAIAVDASGNVYVAGGTTGNMDGNTNPTQGSNDVFIVKYDSFGNRLWTIQKGTVLPEIAYGIAIDPGGYFYVVGASSGGLDGVPSNGDSNDFFISKYTPGGVLVWTRLYGSASTDVANGIALDSSGNLYVTGYTQGSMPGNTPAGLTDYFVGKYDKDGNQLWLRQTGSSGNDVGQGIAVDGSGNCYVAGYTTGSLNGSNQGLRDLFVARYDAAGIIQWTRQMGTYGDDEARGVAVGPDGNIYVTGYSNSGATAGLDGNTSYGSSEIFVAKYDVLGQKQWTRLLGTQSRSEGWGIAIDLDNNIYTTGFAGGNASGGGATGFCGNPFMGYSDMIIVRHNSAGEMQ